ncbi:MAG: mechanosensitive ion channel family protein [Bacteroidetes bacterium]|nr:MAG: mechanosensitive ion channel family protein [Bacteroidota bacterium]TAF95591.1 MAG: mechanosensitive ion channel family protein [Bacteroidota bacterium]
MPENFWKQLYLNNQVIDYVAVTAGLLLLWVILRFVKTILLRILTKKAAKTPSKVDDVVVFIINKYIVPLGYITINYWLIHRLNLHPVITKLVHFVVTTAWVYLGTSMVNSTMQQTMVLYMRHKGETEHRITQVSSMLLIVKGVVWAFGFLILLANLGVNVTAAVTGLGIGGIAIALAAQNILGDLFSYFVIFFDKPFEIGDTITINGNTGTVESIGIKTAHVRSLDGQLFVVPNAELVKSTIQNFQQMPFRRYLLKLPLEHSTPASTLEKIAPYLGQHCKHLPNVEFVRCHNTLLNNNGIILEAVFIIHETDYIAYLNTVESINLALLAQLQQWQVEVAGMQKSTIILPNTAPETPKKQG